MTRRDFLEALVAAATLAAAPGALAADFWELPRELWIKVPRSGEEQRVTYFAQGALVPEGYVAACRLLRDVRSGTAVQMDVGLLNLLRAVQGWLAGHDVHRPLVVLSGYRTQATNDVVSGARASMHLYGRAADIDMPGVPAEYLARLAAYFQGGGLGLYVGRFVHVDTGRVRYWRG